MRVSRFPPAAFRRVIGYTGFCLFAFLSKNGFVHESSQLELGIDFTKFHPSDKVLRIREKLKRNGICTGFYKTTMENSFSNMMRKNFKQWWYSYYKKNMESSAPAPVPAATENRTTLGFAGPIRVFFEGGKAILSTGVIPSHRGKGIGRVLANAWAEELKKLGALNSLILTGSDNIPAQKIYFEMGF